MNNHIQTIKNYYVRYGILPSFREVLNLIDKKSKASVHQLYQLMIEQGLLTKDGTKYYPTELLGSLPLYGAVQAGKPTQEEADIVNHVNIASFLIEHPQSTFLLSIRGDSMVDAGLLEGDIVVVDNSYKEPKIGDIVIATVDHESEYTVKYFSKIKDQPILRPGNPKYDVIVPQLGLNIHGKVIGALRKY